MASWPERALASRVDGHLVRLRHGTYPERSLGDARLTLLRLRGLPAGPTPVEANFYEGKARAAWLLAALDTPHVPTRTFVRFDGAVAYLADATYPRVVKTRIGALSLLAFDRHLASLTGRASESPSAPRA